jgi:hypothetical protein
MRGWPAAIARATVTRDSTTTAARPTARLADRRRPTPQPMRPPSQAASSSTGQCPGRRHPAATSSPIQTVDSCAPSARRRAIWCWSAPVRVSTDARSPVRCTGPRGVRCSVRLSAARAGVPGQVAAVSWTRRRLAQPHLTTSIGGVSGYRDAHISSDRVRRLPVVHSQWRPGHRLCGVPGDVSPSVHVCANCAADVIGGRRRRMGLRPYGIGENGGYLEVADHPRPPASAKQIAPKSLARSRLALPWARSERSTGPRPPLVPVRRLIPVGSSPLCPDRPGSRLVGSQRWSMTTP